jgi:hypothetical protein
MLAPDHVVEGLLHHAYLFAEYLQHVWTDHKILPKQILLAAQQPAKGRVWFMAQLIERTAAASLGSNWAPRRCDAGPNSRSTGRLFGGFAQTMF